MGMGTRVEIKKIHLENYKCFVDTGHVLYHRTEISGKNRQGKSTLMDSAMEVITGKMTDGTMPDNIRRKADGAEVPKVDVVRELTLDINGKETTIKKITKQKWRKPHGQTEEVFDGNLTEYEVDGFPMKAKQFAEFTASIADADTLLTCSNANPFLSILRKSTAEARKTLEKLSGFSVEQFIAERPEFAEVYEISKGHAVEDTLKKLRKQLSDQKKKVEQKNTEIKYETGRQESNAGNDSPSDDLRGELLDNIADIDRQEQLANENAKAYEEKISRVKALIKQKDDMEASANASNWELKQKLNAELTEKNSKLLEIANQIAMSELDLKHSNMAIQRFAADLKDARAEYIKVHEMEFDASEQESIKAEVFDESTLTCPTCHQKLPEEQADKIRKSYEKDRQKRLKTACNEELEWQKLHDTLLADITECGNLAKLKLEEAEKTKKETEQEITNSRNRLPVIESEIDEIKKKIDSIPNSVDMTDNNDYQKLLAEIESAKAEAEQSQSTNMIDRDSLRRSRNEYLRQIAEIDAQIKQAEKAETDKKERITNLNKELRQLSQIQADIEREIDTVLNFSIEKNVALAKVINPHFRHFQFSFLEYTQEGNPVETCKMMCDEIDYFNGLNGGDKKLCEVDLCRGLQEINGLILPIWVDESNTIDAWRIPQDVEQQLILIRRSDSNLDVKEV